MHGSFCEIDKLHTFPNRVFYGCSSSHDLSLFLRKACVLMAGEPTTCVRSFVNSGVTRMPMVRLRLIAATQRCCVWFMDHTRYINMQVSNVYCAGLTGFHFKIYLAKILSVIPPCCRFVFPVSTSRSSRNGSRHRDDRLSGR